MKPVLAALSGLCLMLGSAAAQAQHAHEHGVAELRVAADNERRHDAADAHARGLGHAELVAGYTLRCEAPAALDALGVRLFEAFPRLREIRAERVSAQGQAAATLRPQATVLPLR